MTAEATRAALARAVGECRRLLVGDRAQNAGDLGRQLEAPHGFDPRTGVPRPMDELSHLLPGQSHTARRLRDWHAHLVAGAAGATPAERNKAAYDEMKYELGYTVLHRLCALRMAEERGILTPCVREGRESAGFRVFLQALPDGTGASADELHAFFLQRVFDELAVDLPAVFDRRSPASLLFASPETLQKVLDVVRRTELTDAWKLPDTLGWIFEDYNDPDERQEMRRSSDAPRNARELAIRNQFFTPRWVVELLTDNTLGRRWVESRGGASRLARSCHYLAKLPAGAEREAGALDPRELRVLDPACGSGHFLLYAFDLLEEIYVEAWEDGLRGPEGAPGLREAFTDEAAFRREVPRLIVEHNLFGVDIDPRCIQQAALSLWLHAHDCWERQGTRRAERPALARLNLVCSQSLPAASELREAMVAGLGSEALAELVRELLTRAGEMGLLFRPEQAFSETIAAVKQRYRAEQAARRAPASLFGDQSAPGPRAKGMANAIEPPDETFWEEAESRMREALARLVETDPDAAHFRRRLFAEDVRNGLRLLDLGRLRFDAVLMNPPFGEPSVTTKAALDAAYPNAGHDLYAMFYERALELLAPAGRVGAITSRSWLALPTLGGFRHEVLARKGTVELVADFGYGVLNAKVETAAAVLRPGAAPDLPALWVRLVKTSRKRERLAEAIAAGSDHPTAYAVPARRFETLPERVQGYWMSESLARTYVRGLTVGRVAEVKQGTATADDFRFLRLAWEVPADRIGLDRDWARFAKGGEYRLFFDDVHLVVRWENRGRELAAFQKAYIRNPDFYGRPGVTWPLRNRRFGARVLPAGCAFGHKGPSAFAQQETPSTLLVAVLTSRPVELLLSVRLGIADDDPRAISPAFEVGLIRDQPWPELSPDSRAQLERLAAEATQAARAGQAEEDEAGETTSCFGAPASLSPDFVTFEEAVRHRVRSREDRFVALARIQTEIDTLTARGYGFTAEDARVMDEELQPALQGLPGREPIDDAVFERAYLTKDKLDGSRLPGGLDAEVDVRVEHRRRKQVRLRDEETLCRLFDAPPARIAEVRRRLGLLRDEDRQRMASDVVSWAVGAAFGRWDLRLVRHPEWCPRWADPFDPLPPCPLGQLVSADGLPATHERIASEAWLAERTDPTKLPPNAAGAEVTAQHYSLEVAWDGLLWDDRRREGARDGLAARVDRALEAALGPRKLAWEAELCDALGKPSLAAWLRAPSGFFADHLARYSKSRRSAPLYWPLELSAGLTCWLYAPRLTRELVTRLVNTLHVEVAELRRSLDQLERQALIETRRSGEVRVLQDEIGERQAAHDRLLRLLDDGYAPHPDDGFVISGAPLDWAFKLPKWREHLSLTWKELRRGDYDWAHLARSLWPERVQEKCAKDRSIAIAHGLAAAAGPVPRKRRARAQQRALFEPEEDS